MSQALNELGNAADVQHDSLCHATRIKQIYRKYSLKHMPISNDVVGYNTNRTSLFTLGYPVWNCYPTRGIPWNAVE